MKSGTILGTMLQPFRRNDQRNAERQFASTGAGSQRNDKRNDARIPTPERSTTPLGVERWNGGPVSERIKPGSGKGLKAKWPLRLAGLVGLFSKKPAAKPVAASAPRARPTTAPLPPARAAAPAQKQSPAQAERARCARIVRYGLAQAVEARGDLAPVLAAVGWAFDSALTADAAIDALDARAAVAGLHHHRNAARRG